MQLTHLLTEEQIYAGCRSINLNVGISFFLPPPEQINSELEKKVLKEIILDCIAVVMDYHPGAKLLPDGSFQYGGRLDNSGPQKFRKSRATVGVAIPVVLEKMRFAGYAIPEGFWKKRSHQILHAVREPHKL